MGEIPHEQALVERFKNAPFTVLGVNTFDSKEDFQNKTEEYGVTWPNLFTGPEGTGVPRDWGITSYPTTFLIDSDGYIRNHDLRGSEVEMAVQKLLMEIE